MIVIGKLVSLTKQYCCFKRGLTICGVVMKKSILFY